MKTHFSREIILTFTALTVVMCMPGLAQDKKSKAKPSPSAAPTLITVPESKPEPSPGGANAGQSVDKTVNDFFTLLGKDQFDKAYDQLVAGTQIAERSDQVAALKSKTKEAVKLFGEIGGYELVGIKNVGTHLMCSTYLSLGKNCPLRWKFYFYKSGDNIWRLIDIRVDDRLVEMFDEKPSKPDSTGTGER